MFLICLWILIQNLIIMFKRRLLFLIFWNFKEKYLEDFETSKENNEHMCGQVLYFYIFYIPMKES